MELQKCKKSTFLHMIKEPAPHSKNILGSLPSPPLKLLTLSDSAQTYFSALIGFQPSEATWPEAYVLVICSVPKLVGIRDRLITYSAEQR